MKKYIIILFMIGISSILSAQSSHQIKGKIKDTENRPIAGATIRSLNNRNAVVSQKDGSFSIKLAELPDTLVIESIGFVTNRLFVKEGEENLLISLVNAQSELEDVTINTGIPSKKAGNSRWIDIACPMLAKRHNNA